MTRRVVSGAHSKLFQLGPYRVCVTLGWNPRHLLAGLYFGPTMFAGAVDFQVHVPGLILGIQTVNLTPKGGAP